jgi:hypothetical protein
MRPSSSSRRACPRTRAGKCHIFPIIPNRYAIFELEYPVSDGRIESKILFIMYAPDIMSSKDKFVIATTKDEVKKKLQPFNKEIQVNDWADLNDEAFIKYFKH